MTATKRTAPIAPTDRTDPGPAPDTVLVLDDTPSKRYLLANWLGRGGFTVVEAPTGTEALRMVRTGGIHIVVLDVRLVALRRTPLSAEGPGPWPS